MALEKSKEELIEEIERLQQVNSNLQAQLNQTDFRFLVEGIPGIVYLFSTKNGGLFYSSHVADILGYTPAQLISNPMLWHDSIHPEDLPQVNQIIQRVLEDKSFCIEYRIKDTSGKWHWFEDRSLEFKTTNDDLLVIGHALDITARKEAEKLSNENQEKYQLLFSTMTEGVALNEIIYDENQEMVDYRIIEVNRTFYSTADYHDVQVIGNVATKLYGMSSELIKSFWKTHKELNITQYTKMISPLNNKTFLISTSPFKNDKFVTVFFDITSQEAAELKLKESEARWQFALEGSGDGIWDWNAKTNEVFFSKQWKAMLGYEEFEIGNSLDEWDKRVHPDDKEKCYKDLEKHFSEKTEFYQNEHRMLCKNGNYKWILDRGKVIEWDESGKPLRVIGTHSDITDRKIAEEKAAQLLIERQTILDNIANGIFFLKDRKIIWANRKAAAMYEYTLDEIVGENTLKLHLNEDDYNEFGKVAYAAMSSGKQFSIEVKQKKKSGKEFWCALVGQAINPNNPKEASIWIVEDITLRKNLENELLESEKKLKTIFEVLDIGISITDKIGNIVDCNKAAEKILGITKEQHLSRNYVGSEWKVLRPDLSIMPIEEYASVRAMKENRPISNVEMGVQKPDGDISWIIVNASPIELVNYGVVVSFIDVTELKKIERELRRERDFNFRVMETSFVGIVYLDKDGKIILANPRAVSIFGLTIDEVTNRDYNVPDWQITDLEGNEFPLESLPFVRVKNTLKPVVDIQHSIGAPNGKRVLLSINAAPMIGSNGEFEGVVASIEDITGRKQVEKEVIRQNQELAELNASKDKFFSIIAHDLRGPFSGFLGLTQMMENDEMPLEQMKHLSKLMHGSAENLFKLLENLLTWASMQKGTIEFNPKKYFLSEISNESINVLYDFAKQKNIEIINQVPRNLEVTVDFIMLSTIIRNLISNAIKFTNRGGKVTVGAEEKDNEVLVYVKDNGIGMDSTILENIFRIDQKTTRKGTEKELSTGLGLLLCKEFIEKHHGKIWIESEVDKGSTFYFTIGSAVSYLK